MTSLYAADKTARTFFVWGSTELSSQSRSSHFKTAHHDPQSHD